MDKVASGSVTVNPVKEAPLKPLSDTGSPPLKPSVDPVKVEPVIKKPDPPKFTKIAVPPDSEHDDSSAYPFHDLKVGEGFFVANEDVKGDTLRLMRREVWYANNHYLTVMCDVNGDEIWETIQIHGWKRNDNPQYDQFGNITNEFQLDSSGNTIHSVEEVSRPKYFANRYFSINSVAKDDVLSGTTKAPSDGVVIVREL